MTENNDKLTAVELAQLRTELHATNKTMERIALSVEKTLGDHESRIRAVELICAQNADGKRDLETVKSLVYKALGVIAVVQFVGLPTVAYLVLHAAR